MTAERTLISQVSYNFHFEETGLYGWFTPRWQAKTETNFSSMFCFLRCFFLRRPDFMVYSHRERRPIFLDLRVNSVILSAWLLVRTIPVRSRLHRSLRSSHSKVNLRGNQFNKRKTSMSYIMMVHRFHTYSDINTFLCCLPLFCVNIPLLM